MNPFNHLTDKERETFMRFLTLLNEGSETRTASPDDIAFISNNAQPMVDNLMKAIAKWASEYGMKEDEVGSMLVLLSKLSHLAGGINFADFTITESMLKGLSDVKE